MTTKNKSLSLAFIPLAIGINLGIGAIVQVLKLPVFLDSIGTIIAALILGWRAGAIVGILSFAISTITIFPPSIYFSGTQLCIAIYICFIGKKGLFSSFGKVFASGAMLSVITALASAPVIYYLFGGVTGNGIGIFTIYLEGIGLPKANAVLISGFSAELIDKIAQCLIAFYILKSIPKFLLSKFNSIPLQKNGFTD